MQLPFRPFSAVPERLRQMLSWLHALRPRRRAGRAPGALLVCYALFHLHPLLQQRMATLTPAATEWPR